MVETLFYRVDFVGNALGGFFLLPSVFAYLGYHTCSHVFFSWGRARVPHKMMKMPEQKLT